MRSYSRTYGACVYGAEARVVEVQVSAAGEARDGHTRFQIVGLPDNALREGRERIRGAIAHGGWPWLHDTVTVNLAPASARKEGAALELAIAVGILAAGEVALPPGDAGRRVFFGELGLDGTIRSGRGVLACAEAARRRGFREILVPRGNAREAAAVPGLSVIPVDSLHRTVGHLSGAEAIPPETPVAWEPEAEPEEGVPRVRGQRIARRAAEVAAAGCHNVLLWGPPGVGKTLLARQIRTWLPPLTYQEAVEASRIHSVAGLLGGGLLRRRPFRAPHHTTSMAGLIGGGGLPRPGEMSLAHLGVLFLDELPEFPRPVLESLRQPLEDGALVVGRAAGRARFPAEVLLVGATNPCPCGWHGEERCRCTQREIRHYQSRLSGPLRDRFDLDVHVRPVDPEDLVYAAKDAGSDVGDPARRERAWAMQRRRAKQNGWKRPWNSRIPHHQLPDAVEPTREAREGLVSQARRLGLTGRGIHRLLRVARTLADLKGEREVDRAHVLEAIGLRGD